MVSAHRMFGGLTPLLLSLVGCQGGLDAAAEKALTERVAASVAGSVAASLGAGTVAPKPAPATKSAPPVLAPATPRPSAPVTPSSTAAPTSAASAPAEPWVNGAVGAWPAADRVFAVPMPGGPDRVAGTDGTALWLAEPTSDGQAKRLWRVDGSGVVQKVDAGDFGHGHRLYAARGVGRGHLQAPLVLQEIDIETGVATELWRDAGERNECAHLSIADVDADGQPDLAFAHYNSKYMVVTRHLKADGTVIKGEPVRMASGRTYADLDGDGLVDEVVARVYGDDRGQPGDLRVHLAREGKPPETLMVPTENGVRGIVVTQLSGDAGPTLYFADGWVADYGKNAKARIKRAQFEKGSFTAAQVMESATEFTFFELWAADANGDGIQDLVAQGNARVSAWFGHTGGAWDDLVGLATLEPVLNTALVKGPTGYAVVVPGQPNLSWLPVAQNKP